MRFIEGKVVAEYDRLTVGALAGFMHCFSGERREDRVEWVMSGRL